MSIIAGCLANSVNHDIRSAVSYVYLHCSIRTDYPNAYGIYGTIYSTVTFLQVLQKLQYAQAQRNLQLQNDTQRS